MTFGLDELRWQRLWDLARHKTKARRSVLLEAIDELWHKRFAGSPTPPGKGPTP